MVITWAIVERHRARMRVESMVEQESPLPSDAGVMRLQSELCALRAVVADAALAVHPLFPEKVSNSSSTSRSRYHAAVIGSSWNTLW